MLKRRLSLPYPGKPVNNLLKDTCPQKRTKEEVDTEFFNKALKVTWIKKYLDKNNRGKCRKFLFDFHLEKLGYGLLFTNNLNKMDANKTFNKDQVFIGNPTIKSG